MQKQKPSIFKCKVKSIFKHLLMKENAVQLRYMAHRQACSFPQFSNKILVPPGLRNTVYKSHHIQSVWINYNRSWREMLTSQVVAKD